MKSTRLTRSITAAVAVIALVGIVALANSAQAQHGSYCYTGQRCGCHGEAHMIDALDHINNAFHADCETTRVRETLLAKGQVLVSSREVCDPTAHRLLDDACDHLVHYLGSRHIRELDSASDAILRAISVEQARHAVPAAAAFGRYTVARPVGKSYCFSGRCRDVHGESHVIAAMQHLDDAYRASCDRDRIVNSVLAKQDAVRAHHEMCSHEARRQMLEAIRDIARYQVAGRICDLDEAHAHLQSALSIEQAAHAHVDIHPALTHRSHSPYDRHAAHPHHRGGSPSAVQLNLGGVRLTFGNGGTRIGF
ncbi:MAG: hypothetical protein KDA59_04750 [Planctomycetales bacterium]|nr:hypothetical protein [Planctomycetales bacterium]